MAMQILDSVFSADTESRIQHGDIGVTKIVDMSGLRSERMGIERMSTESEGTQCKNET